MAGPDAHTVLQSYHINFVRIAALATVAAVLTTPYSRHLDEIHYPR